MAIGGRKPTATHLKVVTGNPGKRALNKDEPQAAGELGSPPPGWTADQKALWWEVVNSAPAGVLTGSDRLLVELAVRNLANVRSAGTELTAAQSAEMRRCLGEMGMTPSERARLVAPSGKNENPFADL
ncbi:hypothetical protein [Roseomonas xinghualingensis]|uniref:hypothetical protein n=1 Tax=Roseomonas xinghualingensis TaxID=2986475 RepID=UPI0021F1CBB8|nr:hypothetical protein [Roseomonas sp. SXEYE001]MCV4209979.1 hypothetical protein [Roseomonas sp. SXEYE001]